MLLVALTGCICGAHASARPAQSSTPSSARVNLEQEFGAPGTGDLAQAPARVEATPEAQDEEIRTRLQNVLDATGWFADPSVQVDEGVVFLNGRAETDELKKWAGDLARNTEGVVVVVNRVEVLEPSAWDFGPAWSGLRGLWRDFLRLVPFLLFGLLILALSTGAGILTTRSARVFLLSRVRSKLLRSVIARTAGVLVFLFGVYITLRISGLTQLALTVVGGTGLIGLAVGIAFRNITENFLASIFLSMQRPFQTGDLVEIAGVTGYVQQLNVRTTVLMNLEGNLVQIPNATVYKSNLRNFTSNCNRREDFVVGIGYDDAIHEAQEIARRVLTDHPAVLDDPEPWVLADGLFPSTVNLRIYYWINGREHSWLKVRSSIIRLVKRAFQSHGISMPDEAREIVFPKGVPVTMTDDERRETDAEEGAAADGRRESRRDRPSVPATIERPVAAPPPAERDAPSTKAEGGLSSDEDVIKKQARDLQPLKEGDNLLRSTPSAPSPRGPTPSSSGDSDASDP